MENEFSKLEIQKSLKNKMDLLEKKMKNSFKNITFKNFNKNYSSIKIEYLASISYQKMIYDYKNNILFFHENIENISEEEKNHIILRELLNIASTNIQNQTMGIMDSFEHNRGLNAGIRESIINYILKDNYREYQTKFYNCAIIIHMIGFETLVNLFFNSEYEKLISYLKNIIDDRKKIELLFSCIDVSYDYEKNFKEKKESKYNLFEIDTQRLLNEFHYKDTLNKIDNNYFKNKNDLDEYLKNYATYLINSDKIKKWGLDFNNYNGIDEVFKQILKTCSSLKVIYNNSEKQISDFNK